MFLHVVKNKLISFERKTLSDQFSSNLYHAFDKMKNVKS